MAVLPSELLGPKVWSKHDPSIFAVFSLCAYVVRV